MLLLAGLEWAGQGSFGHIGLKGSLLLAGAGVITTIPLLMFGYAAHKIQLSTLGLLQYLAPSINLILGIFIYNEDFSRERMMGFVLIWVGLVLYVAENMFCRYRAHKRPLVSCE